MNTECLLVVLKLIAQFNQLRNAQLPSFYFGGDTFKNCGNQKNPQGLSKERNMGKLRKLGKTNLGKLGARFECHYYLIPELGSKLD